MSLCANCRSRPGTVRWGDALAITHGFTQMWCEICALQCQVAHAEAKAAELPDLRARLASALGNPRVEGEPEWETTPHGFFKKPWERRGDPGFDGDPESCALCHFTEGNPIHSLAAPRGVLEAAPAEPDKQEGGDR